MLVPNTPTQEHGVLAMMNAPLRPGTRPVGAAQLAVKDSSNGPVFAATPKGDGPRPQDRLLTYLLTYLLLTYYYYEHSVSSK